MRTVQKMKVSCSFKNIQIFHIQLQATSFFGKSRRIKCVDSFRLSFDIILIMVGNAMNLQASCSSIRFPFSPLQQPVGIKLHHFHFLEQQGWPFWSHFCNLGLNLNFLLRVLYFKPNSGEAQAKICRHYVFPWPRLSTMHVSFYNYFLSWVELFFELNEGLFEWMNEFDWGIIWFERGRRLAFILYNRKDLKFFVAYCLFWAFLHPANLLHCLCPKCISLFCSIRENS